ncbi:MAG TPA: hypothetical protein VJ808_09720 [Gemmatimonadales bacterium]|nr:hypothetical protein [Gemmatimonadales bacterium]
MAAQWNSPEALALVRRAVERRSAAQADSTLTSYRARAHGFVFFLAQVGQGFTEPPRLVKADELDVEVYWQAPGRSKQIILGWRDGTFLPTDISYHRDHLGIVTDNFGNLIRIGEGDEVRDAVHPLSPEGLNAYNFALSDSLAMVTAEGEIMVHQLQVRPRTFSRPLVIGILYIDVASAELVRFRFSFTPAAYLDRQLEDISVVLESSLHEGRYWLPRRQEVEIRRRVTWLDFPARGIIRGRWEISDYELNTAIPAAVFSGPEIGGLLQPRRSDSSWTEPLQQAIADVAQPVNRQDMETLRAELDRLAGSRALGGLPSQRLAAGSLSDLVKVNRVQGLALGFGAALGVTGTRIRLRPSIGYGTSDDRLTASVTAGWSTGATGVSLGAFRRIADLSDLPVIAPVLNSLLSQEAGKDYGDYVLLHGVDLELRRRLGGRTAVALNLAVEESRSITTEASPATGTYRPNPALGSGPYRVARLALERSSGGIAVKSDLQGRLAVEVGEGFSEYFRGTAAGRWLTEVGNSELLTRVYLGAGTSGLPPHRSFVIGGRGTLPGEPFRAYGGRYMALGHVEWRFEVPVPALSLGSFASTGRRIAVAPFLAGGYAAEPLAGLPWNSTRGVRPVAGVALELFMRLFRVEAGIGLRDGGIGVLVDINRDWWGLL